MASLTKEQEKEIFELKSKENNTYRVVSEPLEKVLYETIPILDHGFIRVVDYMGNDSSIVQAARVSYGKGTKQVSKDKGLINYLMKHYHSTPFEMCEIKYHVKLPIFVARQWVRHRTASINEYSARYSVLDKEYYIPEEDNLAAQSDINRQGRETLIKGEEAQKVLDILKKDAENAYSNYEVMMNENSLVDKQEQNLGLARELARMNLSLNFYTQWYWKIDLHNLLHFLNLRSDSHAQYEIRAYADAILNTVKSWVPLTYDAFMNFRQGGLRLSSKELLVVKQMISGSKVDKENSGLSNREWVDLMNHLGITD
ncbi:FAD-dependent thymidylate synthase [Alphaproteobacteria bacterium]|nr:FAD-dependent thymidylate synthase [Alphaproteobacteria bacterium]